jgi:thiol-disulfide isomerase/thioredoxin
MKKILAIILFLSLSLLGENLNFATLNHEIISITNTDGIFDFKNPKYHNQNVLLFFFGSKCPHCKREIPEIKELSKRDDLKLIGCHAQAMIGDLALKEYIDQVGYKFDILSFSDDINLINYLKAKGMWSGEVPFHVLVNKNGDLEVVELSEISEKLY